MASPDDGKAIVSACESTPYGISTDVKRQDRFWIKSQPYSLADMLANNDSVDQFVGGAMAQLVGAASRSARQRGFAMTISGSSLREEGLPGGSRA